jgi:hypothetical protein
LTDSIDDALKYSPKEVDSQFTDIQQKLKARKELIAASTYYDVPATHCTFRNLIKTNSRYQMKKNSNYSSISE